MVFGLLFSLLPFLLIFVVVRAVTGKGKGAVGGHPVRHFFQYLLLYGLTVITSVGLAGLLERALPHSSTIYSSTSDLAAMLAFSIVGLPLLALMANWTRRRFRAEPTEKDAFAWGVYLTFAGLTALVVAMQSLQSSLLWLTSREGSVASDLASALVWTAVWSVHWWLDRVVTPHGQTRLHHGVGSLISLVWAAVGLGMLTAAVLRELLPLRASAIFDSAGNAIANGAITFLVGALAWYCYWVRTYAKAKRDALWDAFTMVVGVGGGLVTAVVASSVFLYKVLVWAFGSPGQATASEHFSSVPSSAAALFVGVLVWWYHREVFTEQLGDDRTEGRRIYEYVVAAIGLLSAAAGILILLAALIETFTSGVAFVGNDDERNTLWAAVTLLVVGAPVWGMFWRRVSAAVVADRQGECQSPARRFYLFMLFGIGGTAAVVSLLIAVYELFNDVVGSGVDANTLRSMRWALGVLITTGAVAGYHWLVYRGERDVVAERSTGLAYVLLAGVPDRSLVRSVADASGAHVEAWTSTSASDMWTTTSVLAALAAVETADAVVVADVNGLRAIGVDRH